MFVLIILANNETLLLDVGQCLNAICKLFQEARVPGEFPSWLSIIFPLCDFLYFLKNTETQAFPLFAVLLKH